MALPVACRFARVRATRRSWTASKPRSFPSNVGPDQREQGLIDALCLADNLASDDEGRAGRATTTHEHSRKPLCRIEIDVAGRPCAPDHKIDHGGDEPGDEGEIRPADAAV